MNKPENLITTEENEQDIYMLEKAKGLFCQLSRIGYKEEGLRLTFADEIPYNLHFEVQLSKRDVIWLVNRLLYKLRTQKDLQ